mmetsp:Transcript_9436/g.18471  ORF Transcript_9436/g.18471 Transcript_9436/m.18471 type:complete len:241 (+) Transcript_9436:185-907(+)|eukprot:3257964-Pleurochrysis_carterae.AAC.2
MVLKRSPRVREGLARLPLISMDGFNGEDSERIKRTFCTGSQSRLHDYSDNHIHVSRDRSQFKQRASRIIVTQRHQPSECIRQCDEIIENAHAIHDSGSDLFEHSHFQSLSSTISIPLAIDERCSNSPQPDQPTPPSFERHPATTAREPLKHFMASDLIAALPETWPLELSRQSDCRPFPVPTCLPSPVCMSDSDAAKMQTLQWSFTRRFVDRPPTCARKLGVGTVSLDGGDMLPWLAQHV